MQNAEVLQKVFPKASDNSCNLITATRRSGKSTLMVNLLRNIYMGEFDFVYIWYPLDIDSKNHPYRQFKIPENRGMHIQTFDREQLVEIMEKQQAIVEAPGGHNIRCLLVMDDVISAEQFKSNKGDDPIAKLGSRGRHINITSFILSQKLTAVNSVYRENCDVTVYFNHTTDPTQFVRENSFHSENKVCKKLIKYCTRTRYGFLVVSGFYKTKIACYDSDQDEFMFINCAA